MNHNMILSASGWRKVFAESGQEEDTTERIGNDNIVLSYLIGKTFSGYIKTKYSKKQITVVVAQDTRPTGIEIAHNVLLALKEENIDTIFIGTASAPEVMAYARNFDGFVYISASHNPIGHNGIKFGLNDGGVIPGSEAKIVIADFENKCKSLSDEEYNEILSKSEKFSEDVVNQKKKKEALEKYTDFISHVITGTNDKNAQKDFFSTLKTSLETKPLSVICDMNGSARCLSIDKKFIPDCGVNLVTFNDQCGQIVHAIIPEPENLIHCAAYMEKLQKGGDTSALLGYMPDCDGDRGNIVYWDEKEEKAKPIPAQEVFALCVLAELSFEMWKNTSEKKLAVAVNCPTSMRIDEITEKFGAKLFRAEVGEANVVNLAREKLDEGYNVRIYGEGSNGGNITYPSAVRDPVATVFAMIKLLAIRDANGKKGLFHLWCDLTGKSECYHDDFTLADIIATLPQYVTTRVSEKRAIMKVSKEDKGQLKLDFKTVFEKEFSEKSEWLHSLGIESYECVITNGTKETVNPESWNNGNGGLKIKFYNKDREAHSFIWMRPSGTEPVFRIMCDVKGSCTETEKQLLEWETNMLEKADKN